MRFTGLAAVAACHSVAMRPSLGRVGISQNIARVGDIVSKISGPSDSLVALKDATSIVNNVLAEVGNATDHISGDDAELLNSVISLVEKTIYSSMDDSHQADIAELNAAIHAASQCNADVANRQSPDGDLGILHQAVQDKQTDLIRLQGDVDDKTEVNNTKWEAFDSHMQQISNPPACPGLPARTMPALNVFFEKSEYSFWFTAQQFAYNVVRDAFVSADSALENAIQAYNIQKAVRDVQYCDWKRELQAACAAFDVCFSKSSDFYTNTLVPRVTKDMEGRIEVNKAGDTLTHQIKFLLGDVAEQQTPAIDTSRYEVDFPILPPKGECDLSVLDSSMWVPVVDCGGGQFCLRIVTGTSANNDGHLTVIVEGSELQTLVDGSAIFGRGDIVVAGDTCYRQPIREIRVSNPGNNAWTGIVEYSSDEGSSFQPMYCIGGCNLVGPADRIVVDGNSDGHNQADLACLKGKACTLIPGVSGPHCLRIVTGTSSANNGHLKVFVDGSEFLDGDKIFGRGDVVVAGGTCFQKPIQEVSVQNPGNDAWTGIVEYSSDEGVSFQPMYCAAGCNKVGSTDQIVVDGNSDGHNQADLECLNGNKCMLVAEEPVPPGL